MRYIADRLAPYAAVVLQWIAIGVLILAVIAGLCVMPGLTVVVGVFAWFWWAREGDELDDEINALLMEAAKR